MLPSESVRDEGADDERDDSNDGESEVYSKFFWGLMIIVARLRAKCKFWSSIWMY